MIHVYSKDNTNYDREGNAVIIPLNGKVKKVAAGAYDLNFTAAIDDEGKWRYMVNEAVVKAPVPKEKITTATTGIDVDIYKTTAATAMRDGTSEPTTITYSQWHNSQASPTVYSVGSKVTYSGQNYQCIYWDASSGQQFVPPNNNSTWWRRIANKTEGSPVLANLKSGTQLIYISGPSSGWYKFETKDGIQGYVKSSDVEFYVHKSASENQPRTITTQLFRIKDVIYDEGNMTVSVYATHVSYDLNGIPVAGVSITRKNPATTISKITDGMMWSYPQGDIYTDFGTSNKKKYTGEINGKSCMNALLDPDTGVVSSFDAEFRRDNWDVFIMKKKTHDNGYWIRTAKNLKGVQWKRSSTNLALRMVPVAKNSSGDNLLLSPTHWLNSEHADDFPVKYGLWMKVQGQSGRDDGSESGTNWTNTTLRAEMERQAQEKFDVDKVDQIMNEVTVDFQMMGDTEEYSFLKSIQSIDIYDTIHIKSDVTGMSADVTVQELEFDIVREIVTRLTASDVRNYSVKNVSGFNVRNNSISWAKMSSDAIDGINEDLKSWVEDNFQMK